MSAVPFLTGRTLGWFAFQLKGEAVKPGVVTLQRLRDLMSPLLCTTPLPMKSAELPTDDEPDAEEAEAEPWLNWGKSKLARWAYLSGTTTEPGDLVDAGEWVGFGYRIFTKKVDSYIVKGLVAHELAKRSKLLGNDEEGKPRKVPKDEADGIRDGVKIQLLQSAVPSQKTISIFLNVRTCRLLLAASSPADADAAMNALRPLLKSLFGDDTVAEPLDFKTVIQSSRPSATLPEDLETKFTDWLVERAGKSMVLVGTDPVTDEYRMAFRVDLDGTLRARYGEKGQIEIRGEAIEELAVVHLPSEESAFVHEDSPILPLDQVRMLQIQLAVEDLMGDHSMLLVMQGNGLAKTVKLSKEQLDVLNVRRYDSDDALTHGATVDANCALRLDVLDAAIAMNVGLWTAFNIEILGPHFEREPYLPVFPDKIGAFVQFVEEAPPDLPAKPPPPTRQENLFDKPGSGA